MKKYISILTTVFSLGLSFAAYAQETLIDITFDENIDAFQTFMEGGSFELSNEEGELVCSIHSCGSKDYANQAYWDGFSLTEGCEYTFSFDIHSDIERKLEYRMQLNGGDYHAYEGEFIEVGPEVTHIETTFVMEEETDPAPRLAFNMGYQDDMTEDPGEHKVYIDNISLVMISDEGALVQEEEEETRLLSVNQVGYLSSDKKTVITDAAMSGQTFDVCKDDSVVYSGIFGESMYDAATDTEICQGDFSEVIEEGKYTIKTTDAQSYEFTIGEDVYDDLYSETVHMLTLQRCGIELGSERAGDYKHPFCHLTDAIIYGTENTKEVSGGWHDAGDYGRYVVSGAKTVADLLLTYEDNKNNQKIVSDDTNSPESGNYVPDILDEVRYELEWMLKMQEENGGVYHKVTCANFPGTVMPQDETEELILSPISITATADFAAVMAKASVDFRPYDLEFASACLGAAEDAWNYIVSTDERTGFHNPSDIVTGEYPDESVTDEIFWAAVELYQAGSTEEVSECIEESMNEGVNNGLGWMDVGTYGLYDLAKSDHARATDAKAQMLAQADALVAASEQDGYFSTLGTDYPWGSNMSIANNGMLLGMANTLEENDKYVEAAGKQLDYLLGCNGLGICYVTGFGTKTVEDPHHRPSQVVGKAVPGMLAGGPNKNLEDPYAQQVLAGTAPALCYVDNQQSYSTNEVAIYWNSPLINLVAGK